MNRVISIETRDKLSKECQNHGFVKRGNAYFRVIGDGVLQVVKFEYERNGDCYHLYLGLQSLYGELEPQWLTARGCIPQYCVTRIYGEPTAKIRKRIEGVELTPDSSLSELYQMVYDMGFIGNNDDIIADDTGVYISRSLSPEEQVEMLTAKGLPWLDLVDTQEKLLDAMVYLESCSFVRWNDIAKIAPCLVTKQFDKAELIVCSILQQHYYARSNYPFAALPLCSVFNPLFQDNDKIRTYTDVVWDENDYALYANKFATEEDGKLLMIHEWLHKMNHTDVERYISENYKQNNKLCKFCS